MATLPSLNSLAVGVAAEECEDMYLAPLASTKCKGAFITEVTPPSEARSPRGGRRRRRVKDAAFDGWTLVRSMRRWRRAGERGRRRWGREAVATWAREEAEAARCLVCLRHAGLDPTQERDGREAAEGREERKQVEATVARLVACVIRGSLPGLRRVGEAGTARMGRRVLASQLLGPARLTSSTRSTATTAWPPPLKGALPCSASRSTRSLGGEELPSPAEVELSEGCARRRVEANGGVQRPDQEGGAGAH